MQRWISVLCVSLLTWNLHVSAYQHFNWAYAGSLGPSSWCEKYPECGGSQQSPINIDTKNVDFVPTLEAFKIKRTSAMGNYTVKNLGLNVEIFFEGTVWEATVKDQQHHHYTLEQIHFHWGSRNTQGSEHTIDGRRYPIEAHIVMWNSHLYPNASTASSGVNGLAVLSILFEVDNTAPVNPVMESIVEALGGKNIKKCPCKTYEDIAEEEMPGFDINQLIPRNARDFYRYQGSLTTPPCTQNVMWTIYRETAYITDAQLAVFRSLWNRPNFNGGRKCMCDNFRPVQPLNPRPLLSYSRVVTASFHQASLNYKYLASSPISDAIVNYFE